MINRRGFRFSLATLLLFTTGFAILLGYTQWRQQNLLREIKALDAWSFTVTLRDTGLNRFWPTVEKVAPCNQTKLSDEKLDVASRVYTVDEWLANLESCYDRLRNIGVEDIKFITKGEERDWYYVSTTTGK